MKSVLIAALFFFAFPAFANANEDNDNWPCYLRKCKMNDPDIKRCLLRNANNALLSIFGGDKKLGIPDYNKYVLPNITLGRFSTFKLHFDEAHLFGVSHMLVDDMDWNFQTKTVDIKFVYHNAVTLGGPYDCTGTFKGRSVKGRGQADLIFVGGNKGGIITYNMQYELMKVGGNDYIQIKNRTCTCPNTSSMRLNFNNELISKEQAEADFKFLNAHSTELHTVLNPEIHELFCSLTDQTMNAIVYQFPMSSMFDTN